MTEKENIVERDPTAEVVLKDHQTDESHSLVTILEEDI